MISSSSAPNTLKHEYIEVVIETVAAFREPVTFNSIEDDSSVLLHLGRKACAPGIWPSKMFVNVDAA
jgi:3'-phosphoadenosine 5'-phosphosulfate sulfotransferase (PAPS reductase)/FAD synthetase